MAIQEAGLYHSLRDEVRCMIANTELLIDSEPVGFHGLSLNKNATVKVFIIQGVLNTVYVLINNVNHNMFV